jgi:abequosyltransferase
MQKLLTITIPTYNRAEMLDEQLAWLSTEIKGHESECEIIIYDNCSTDNTFAVISKWQLILSEAITFNYNRNHKNIGGMLNLTACMQAATGKYVWTLGDDDPIEKGTLAYILQKLKLNSNLTLILLNGYGRDKFTHKIIVDNWFDRASDKSSINSKSEFEYFLNRNMGGILFISAAIYHTELLKEALRSWENAHTNLAAQAYWVAYCAAGGSFIVTSNLHTECAMGIGYTDKDPQWTFKMQFICIPEVYLKLMKTGYSEIFCFSMIVQNFRSINSFKILLGGFRRWFLFATKGFIFYLGCVILATWKILLKSANEQLQMETIQQSSN